MKKSLSLLLFSFLSYTLFAQDISGYVLDNKTNEPIPEASVKITPDKENAETKTVKTADDGYYEIEKIITGIETTHPLADDNIKLIYNGDQIQAILKSKIEPQTGGLFAINGVKVKEIHFEPTPNFNEYKAVFNTNGLAIAPYILNDGLHAIQLISGEQPFQRIQTKQFGKKTPNTWGYEKSAISDKTRIIVEVDDDEKTDKYQPLKDTFEITKGSQVDFNLKEWIKYYANIQFHVKNNKGEDVESAQIEIETPQGIISKGKTIPSGYSIIDQIPVRNIEGNEEIPDTVDLKLKIEHENYNTLTGLVQNVTQGNRFEEFILTSNQIPEEKFADLYTIVTQESNNGFVVGASVKGWTTGLQDTTFGTTNTNGEMNILGINIPVNDQGNATTITYNYQVTKEGLEDFLTNFALTEGTYTKNFEMTKVQTNPTEKEYIIAIESNRPNSSWTATGDEGSWSGNTGSNSLDTIRFESFDNTEVIDFSATNEGYTDFNTQVTAQAGQITKIYSIHEIIEQLIKWGVIAKDSETGNLLDSIDVLAYSNGNIVDQVNSGDQTTARLQTWQSKSSINISQLIGRNGYENNALVNEIVNEGEEPVFTYTLVKKTNTTPTEKDYMIIINSQDGKGNNNPDANWEITNLANNTSWIGNTGSNSLDTLLTSITNATMNVRIESNKDGYDDYTTTKTFNEGKNNVTLINPLTMYNYNVTINTRDKDGNKIPNANVTFYDESMDQTWTENSGSNAIATVEYSDTEDNSDIEVTVSADEYYDDIITKNIHSGNNTLTSDNVIITYPYYANIKINNENGIPMDSIHVIMNYNNQKVDEENSLSETEVNLEMQAAGHTQPVELILDRNGYVRDTLETILNEGEANNLVYSLVKENSEPEDAVAYLTRLFSDPTQSGSIADITITNPEFDYYETRTGVENNGIWLDTVPVNPTGTTEYKIKIVPRPGTGDYDLYPLETIITLQANTNAQGIDEAEKIRQEQRIKGKVIDGVTKSKVGGYTITIKDKSGNTVETIYSSSGTFMSDEMYSLDFEGSMDVKKAGDSNYRGHKGIPIRPKATNTYDVNFGPLLLPTEINRFSDTINYHNPALLPATITDPKTGIEEAVDMERIRRMDGDDSYFLPTSKNWPINVYFKEGTTTEQKAWTQSIFDLINDDFGIPFKLNEVTTSLPESGITVKSLYKSYLNTIKSQTGINLEVSDLSGVTYRQGDDEVDVINIHPSANVRILEGTTIMNGENYSGNTIDNLRELLYRTFHTTEFNGDVSISNGSTPGTMTEAEMTEDRIHYKVIYELRKGRTESDTEDRIGTGSYTYTVN